MTNKLFFKCLYICFNRLFMTVLRECQLLMKWRKYAIFVMGLLAAPSSRPLVSSVPVDVLQC